MNVDLEVQKAIRARLVSAAVLPAASIRDANARPSDLPAILLGDSQAVDEGTSLTRAHTRVHHTLHIWTREPSLEGVKALAGAVRAAIHAGRLALTEGLACADVHVSSMRFLRDPDGEHSHGVVVVEVLAVEVSA